MVHNLGRYPSVICLNSASETVEGEVQYDGLNQLTIFFSAAFAGTVICG